MSTCRRKIFVERFPSLALPRVKFTKRLQEALKEMGFEQGGEAGARLGKKLGYPGSPDTILRLVKQTQLSTPSSLRVVGIDDWSWKRGLRYGTLICDLFLRVFVKRQFSLFGLASEGCWYLSGLSVKFGEKSSSAEYLENLHPLRQRFLEARS